MDPNSFTPNQRSQLVRIPEAVWAFVPPPLPPSLPLDWKLVQLIGDADRNLSQLAGSARNLRNPQLLVAPFMRREAVLSSRIEGTQASLSDLASYEALGIEQPKSDVREVSNYSRALNFGLDRIKELPISLRLIREIHERLMHGVRGADQSPGEFRKKQVHIGPPGTKIDEATYVPPPHAELSGCLDKLERYIHADSDLPPLIRLALVHYQFEAIHPFLDGNGRVGRLLITLSLVEQKHLPQPLLYLSAFFERHRADYYRLLLGVSQKTEWREWIEFFLRGVSTQSLDAIRRANRIQGLELRYREQLQEQRSSGVLLKLTDSLFISPVINAGLVSTQLNITIAAAQRNIDKLSQAGILREVTGRKRDRIYVAEEILKAADDPEPEQQQMSFADTH